MSNQNLSSGDKHSSPIDDVLNQNQEGEISRPESVEGVGFGNKADDLARRPGSTSQEHSLDDIHEMQTPSCLEEDFLGQAAENATKRDSAS